MKKILIVVMAVVLAVTAFVGCAQAPAATEAPSAAAEPAATEAPAAEEPAATEAPAAEEPAAEEPAAEEPAAGDATVPEGVAGGKKIAVVRNLQAGDHTQQFLDGCVSEGQSFGFTVDTFVTDGDNARLQEQVAQVIQKDYDGLIVSHGQLEYSYDMLKPARDKGMVVSTFDTLPLKDGKADGEQLEGVTSTAQDDHKLAELSLGSLVENTQNKPAKILKLWFGPGVPPLDRRQEVYAQYEADGLIQTLELIAPNDMSVALSDTTTKTESILPKYPEGTVDAIWGSYDELAKGALIALNDAGRKDIPMFTIDISNDDIKLMKENPDVWISTAAVDPKLIGIANMRLIALKLAGEETPAEYTLDAQLVKTSQLTDGISMETLATVVDGWGTLDSIADLNRPWMDTLRAENGGAAAAPAEEAAPAEAAAE